MKFLRSFLVFLQWLPLLLLLSGCPSELILETEEESAPETIPPLTERERTTETETDESSTETSKTGVDGAETTPSEDDGTVVLDEALLREAETPSTMEPTDDSETRTSDEKTTTIDTLLFSSGFEDGVVLEPPFIDKYGSQWWQNLSGSDRGFLWPDDLTYNLIYTPRFQFLVRGDKPDLSSYVINKIEEVTDWNGSPTRALKMTIFKDDPDYAATIRSQYILYPKSDLTQAYIRYRIKYQKNLEEVMAFRDRTTWRLLTEWFENGHDYRVGVYIGRGYGESKSRWIVQGQKYVSGEWVDDWQYDNYDVPVPAGEWFLFEMFWKLHPVDGKIVVAIDGQEIVNHTGRTQLDDGIGRWFPIKLYTGTNSLENGKDIGGCYQWLDDIEIYSSPPPDASIQKVL